MRGQFELPHPIENGRMIASVLSISPQQARREAVLAFVEGSQFHLVETLAEHIAMLLLETSASPGCASR